MFSNVTRRHPRLGQQVAACGIECDPPSTYEGTGRLKRRGC